MRFVKGFVLSIALAIALASPAIAHTLKDVQEQLGEREAFFQPIDRATPHFRLEDPDGRKVGLEDFRGKVVVLHFIYTTCPDVCPLHAERIAEVQKMINGTPMRDLVQFVTITTDPENDTAEVMREYGQAHGLDSANWVFLTSGPDQPEATRALAEHFGHKFTKTDDGYQMHGIVTHVIDRDGRWQANFHGLKFSPMNFVVYVNALTNVAVPHGHGERSFWDKVRGLF